MSTSEGRNSSLKSPKRLLDLSPKDKQHFLESFDHILTDCDGVVWQLSGSIDGIGEAITALKAYGKHIVYVSNNSVRSFELYLDRVRQLGHDVDKEDLIHPAVSIVKYLKRINFQGLIYAIGSVAFLDVLRSAGYEVLCGPNDPMPESLRSIISAVYDKKPVKAVIIDSDLNYNHIKLMRAELYLKASPECLLIAGATDRNLVVRSGFELLGFGIYLDVLENATSKKALILGKPGPLLGEQLKMQYQIKDSKRALFVGDMLVQDIAFGNSAGFQTLLVLTGGTKQRDVDALRPGDNMPDYIIDSFADLKQVVEDVLAFKSKASL